MGKIICVEFQRYLWNSTQNILPIQYTIISFWSMTVLQLLMVLHYVYPYLIFTSFMSSCHSNCIWITDADMLVDIYANIIIYTVDTKIKVIFINTIFCILHTKTQFIVPKLQQIKLNMHLAMFYLWQNSSYIYFTQSIIWNIHHRSYYFEDIFVRVIPPAPDYYRYGWCRHCMCLQIWGGGYYSDFLYCVLSSFFFFFFFGGGGGAWKY